MFPVVLLMFAVFFFFFNDTATTEIYTLSLHDALPIWPAAARAVPATIVARRRRSCPRRNPGPPSSCGTDRTTRHRTSDLSELQAQREPHCVLLGGKRDHPGGRDPAGEPDCLGGQPHQGAERRLVGQAGPSGRDCAGLARALRH